MRRLTDKVSLPGEQARLKQLILYVAERCQGAEFFGAIKLNKIIWKADFDSFAARKIPVTGREYRRLRLGPAAKEMRQVHREMLMNGSIIIERRDFGDNIIEMRTVAVDRFNASLFTAEDLSFVDAAITHYWGMSGTETSDESHGIAWKTRDDNDPMPYDLALLSDKFLSPRQLKRAEDLIYEKGWISQ